MGLKLVREVLDHYRGPDHKFRWLIAFTFTANDATRVGWPGRELIAWRTQKSPARVSNIATELVEDGVIKRDGGGGKYRGGTRYVLLPLAAGDPQSSPMTNSDSPVDNQPQGSPSANPQAGVKGSQESVPGFAQDEPQGSRETQQPAETPDRSQRSQEESDPRVRAMLRAADADVTDDEIREVITILTGRGANDVVKVLRREIGRDNGRRLLGEARRIVSAPAASRPAPRPDWCGQCGEQSRMIEVGDDKAARCPRCHPRRQS